MRRLHGRQSRFEKYRDAVRDLGLTLTMRDGEYRVNYVRGLEDSAYYTDDLDDALGTAKAMSTYLRVQR